MLRGWPCCAGGCRLGHQHHSQQVAQAAAQAKADGLRQRKALGALHQRGAQHAAVHGGNGQDADEQAAAGAFDRPQDGVLKDADHRHAAR